MYAARLRISELLEEDEGKEFTIKVSNDVGSVNLTVILDDLEKGIIIYSCKVYSSIDPKNSW